jgi:menaquinone-dependent protoporphyrinogen oxidase
MAKILVMFGTTDGHTAKVADALASRLRRDRHDVDVVNAAYAQPGASVYDAVIVAASVHAGGYQREVAQWVLQNFRKLNAMPTVFVSVCLGVLQHEPKVDRELQTIVKAFLQSTNWQPLETKVVAGALKYTRYNFVERWLMKRIVRKAGGDTDTSRDYEYTDWADLQEFADRFSARLPVAPSAMSA